MKVRPSFQIKIVILAGLHAFNKLKDQTYILVTLTTGGRSFPSKNSLCSLKHRLETVLLECPLFLLLMQTSAQQKYLLFLKSSDELVKSRVNYYRMYLVCFKPTIHVKFWRIFPSISHSNERYFSCFQQSTQQEMVR